MHYETFCPPHAGINYGVDIFNLDEKNIRICSLVYKYRYLTYIVCSNGYRYSEHSIKF